MFKGLKVLKLIKRDPGELGFVIQAKDYEEYVSTYTEIGCSPEEIVYSEEEFKFIKSYFK